MRKNILAFFEKKNKNIYKNIKNKNFDNCRPTVKN